MPLKQHDSFLRPTVSERLWRYTDLPKFLELISANSIWLSNAEILAQDDPYEGHPGALRFPHRAYKSVDQTPDHLREHILSFYGEQLNKNPDEAFEQWFMSEEQMCLMSIAGRRNFFVNCWHAAEHESIAMWKIYGSTAGGCAIISNGARIEAALKSVTESLYLGKVTYVDPSYVQFGGGNAFDPLMKKRSSYAYENEVRLVHWDTNT